MADDTSTTEAQALYDQGKASFEAGRYDEALDTFAEVALHPGLPGTGLTDLNWNMALCFAHQADWAKARAQLEASGGDEAEFKSVLAARGVSWPAAPGSREEAEQHYAFAKDAMEAGEHETALNAMAGLMLHPGLPSEGMDEMHWNMALCCAHLGRIATALGHLQNGGQSVEEFRATLAPHGIVIP